ALAITAIACVALVSRFFPSTFGVEPSTILPTINSRLSYPLGYWNGLGIEIALAYPLLLSIMASRRSRLANALAALPLPILGAVLAIALSHPVAKFDVFKSNSFTAGGSNTSYVNTHLLSSSGSGRWQFWAAAGSEFQAHPLNGGGAGSWQSWWLQHDSLGSFFTQYT